jgi:hypothetical protein
MWYVQNVIELEVNNGDERIGTTSCCVLLHRGDNVGECRSATTSLVVRWRRCQRNGIGDVFACMRDGDVRVYNAGEYRKATTSLVVMCSVVADSSWQSVK